MLRQILQIRSINHIIDVTLRNPVRNILPQQGAVIGTKPLSTGAVEDQFDAAFGRVANVLQAVVLELGALGAVIAVDVAEGWGEPVDTGGDEFVGLGGGGEDAFEFGGVLRRVVSWLERMGV
jgi:hypothetical protein